MMIVTILGVSYFSSKPDYGLLFSSLDHEDTVSITGKLNNMDIPYKLANGGQAILVPKETVLELRLELASDGLPSESSVGFELFDSSTFGMTEFAQRVNLQRALQGELERTINQFREIKDSRVHIATPAHKLFAKDQDDVTASIIVNMRGNHSLNREQTLSIVHLVAAAVERLQPENVTVVDVQGRVLYGNESSDSISKLTSNQLEYKESFTSELEDKVSSMLENIVGSGKVVTRVTADFDFTQVETTEKKYDPASQVARSEKRTEEATVDTPSSGNPVGVRSNIPTGSTIQNIKANKRESNHNQETVNYEINETVSHVVNQVGAIKKLSVAVVVDGRYKVTLGENREEIREFIPRTKEELDQLKELVMTAVGLDLERGDAITIQSSPFESNLEFQTEQSLAEGGSNDLIQVVIPYIGIALLVGGLFFFLIIPMARNIINTSSDINLVTSFPETLDELVDEPETTVGSKEARNDSKSKIKDLVQSDPKLTAELLREWLKSHG